MAIPEEFRGRVLAYCQEPEPEEADLLVLDQAWDSAESYLKGAGVTRPGPENAGRLALWLSVMLAMVLDEYDQRGAQFDAGKLQDNPVFRRKLTQLKLSGHSPHAPGPCGRLCRPGAGRECPPGGGRSRAKFATTTRGGVTMTPSIDAGKLRERLEVMELKEGPNGVWTWESVRKARGQVELNTVKKNLFSSVGIGARGAELVLRRQPLTLHQAILWGERHLFLTAVLPEGRLHLRVQAALVEPVTCLATRTEDTVGEAGRPETRETMRQTFPGVLTEKYVRYEREETHAETDASYVLVVPKMIVLRSGDLVTVQEGPAKAVYNGNIKTACKRNNLRCKLS